MTLTTTDLDRLDALERAFFETNPADIDLHRERWADFTSVLEESAHELLTSLREARALLAAEAKACCWCHGKGKDALYDVCPECREIRAHLAAAGVEVR